MPHHEGKCRPPDSDHKVRLVMGEPLAQEVEKRTFVLGLGEAGHFQGDFVQVYRLGRPGRQLRPEARNDGADGGDIAAIGVEQQHTLGRAGSRQNRRRDEGYERQQQTGRKYMCSLPGHELKHSIRNAATEPIPGKEPTSKMHLTAACGVAGRLNLLTYGLFGISIHQLRPIC